MPQPEEENCLRAYVYWGYMLCPLRARIKKKPSRLLATIKEKNGRQIQKRSRQIVQEQKLRSEPHLIGIVVRLLGLNTLQKFHPPVATA